MNPFIERTIHWGIMHVTLTYNFRNYANITFFDVKYNLCDYLDDIIKEQCPVHPGIYHINSYATMSKLLWPVRNRYIVSLLLLF